MQVAPGALGSLSYALNTTLAATIVWKFLPNWHLKLNYAEGFRPPVFNNTTSNGEDVQIGGNPNLTVETSNATQAEINARIFKGERRIRELSFRVDGSYTRVNNLIQVSSGNYGNSGDRGLLSFEFLGKLYLTGDHFVTGMKVTVTIDVTPSTGVAKSKIDDTRVALRELGLSETIKTTERKS